MGWQRVAWARRPGGSSTFAYLSLVALVTIGAGVSGCSSSTSSSAGSPQSTVATTTATVASTTTAPADSTATARAVSTATTPAASTTTSGKANACPPGCKYPADHDAITVLASSATFVALVTVHGPAVPRLAKPTDVTTDEVLQTNFNHLVYGASKIDMASILYPAPGYDNVMNHEKYLVFASSNRGGTCLSALYSFDPATQKLNLVQSNDGWNNQIKLSDRMLDVPRSTTLSAVRSRLYPTGDVVYPIDLAESNCPG